MFEFTRKVVFLAFVVLLINVFALKSMYCDFSQDFSCLSDQELVKQWERSQDKILNDVLDQFERKMCEGAVKNSDQKQREMCESTILTACKALEQKAGRYWSNSQDMREFLMSRLGDDQEISLEDQKKVSLAVNVDICQARENLLIEAAVREKACYLAWRHSEPFLERLSELELSQKIDEATGYVISVLFTTAQKQSCKVEFGRSPQAGKIFFQKKAADACEAFYQKSVAPLFPDVASIEALGALYAEVERKRLKGEPLTSDQLDTLTVLDTFFMCQVAVTGPDILKARQKKKFNSMMSQRFKSRVKRPQVAKKPRGIERFEGELKKASA